MAELTQEQKQQHLIEVIKSGKPFIFASFTDTKDDCVQSLSLECNLMHLKLHAQSILEEISNANAQIPRIVAEA